MEKIKITLPDGAIREFDKGVTVLFVSHSLEQVKRLCDRAIILEKGHIIANGTVDEVSAIYEEKLNK